MFKNVYLLELPRKEVLRKTVADTEKPQRLTRLLFPLLDAQIVAIKTHSEPTPVTHPVYVEYGGGADITHLSYTLNSTLVSHGRCKR